MRKTLLAPAQLLRSVEKIPLARPVTWCCTTSNAPLEVAPGQREIHVNSYRFQTMHLRETAFIYQTREILTSKPTFIQGVSEKLPKNEEHKSPLVHTFIWCFSIV